MRIRYIDEIGNENILEVKGYLNKTQYVLCNKDRITDVRKHLGLKQLTIPSLVHGLNLHGEEYYYDGSYIDFNIPYYLPDCFTVDENTEIHLVYIKEFSLCRLDIEDFRDKTYDFALFMELDDILQDILNAVNKYNYDYDNYCVASEEYKIASKYVKDKTELSEPIKPELIDYFREINNKIIENDYQNPTNLMDKLCREIEDGKQMEKCNCDFYKTELLEKGYLDLTTLLSRVNPESKSRIVGYIVRR